jgi:hypothetical protein
MLDNIIIAVASWLGGALVTWWAARHYYKKAGDELRNEAKELRRSTELVLFALLNRDAQIEPRLDAEGRVTGVVVSAVGHASGRSEAKGASL